MNDSNLNNAINKALETDDQVVSIECPCCGKTYYVTKSDAAFQTTVRTEEEYHIDIDLNLLRLESKCPHCGFAGGIMPNRSYFKTEDNK